MDKMMEQLHSEVDRLQTLLEIERICHRATKDKLKKAEHDRDRYKARLKSFEETKSAVAKCLRNGQTIVICKED